MFFEASRFGCRKSIFDATKDTYSMYLCTISGMSREMMKMGAILGCSRLGFERVLEREGASL